MERLNVGFGLAQTLDAVAGLPLTALLQDLNALETLENVAFNLDAAGGFKAGMLGHKDGD